MTLTLIKTRATGAAAAIVLCILVLCSLVLLSCSAANMCVTQHP